MSLDIRTLLLITAMSLVVRAALLGYLWRIDRSYAPVRFWAGGALLFAAGSLMLGLRDAAPEWLSLQVAHATVLAGWLLSTLGTVQAAGLRPPWRPALLLVLLCFLALNYFTLVQPDFVARTVAVTLPQVGLDLFAGVVCWRYRADLRQTTFRILGTILLLSALSNGWKMHTVFTLQIGHLFESAFGWTQYFVYLFINLIGTTACYILLSAQELQRKLADAMAEQTRYAQAAEAARQQADAASRAKSEFLANMSHEIRTPLNGVLGIAQIGYRDSTGHDPSRQTFARILESGQLLLAIVNDILDFSKIEAGKLEVEAIPYRPAAVVDSALAAVHAAASAKHLDLQSEVQDLPPACLGDPIRIQQVLLNLLSNAVKFTPAGQVRLTAGCDGAYLVFTVIDSGIGIAPADQARLFQPFEQADGSTTRKYGGTGLGLTISLRLAQLMGGALSVRSTPGVGSQFQLRLPLVVTDQAVPQDAQARSPQVGHRLAGYKLLVAEDNAINRLVIEDMLRTEGAEVHMAHHGQEAVDFVDSHPDVQLVLMDVQMPVMDGLEATRRIKASRPDLPVLGQTAHALQEEHDRCLAAGMNDMLTKPMEIERLVATLLRWLAPAGTGPGPTTRQPGL